MDRIDAMQAFARVVETRSFTKAADTLHMSKTTVTQLVQQLEARLRVRLLNRTTRKVNVTADGAAYYERVVALLADMDDAETSLSSAYASPSYIERAGTPAHPRDLEDTHHRIVGFLWSRSGKTYPFILTRGDEQLEVQGRHAFAMDDGNAYLAAGLAGLGIVWLPDYMALDPVAQGALVPIFEDWRFEPMPMSVAYPPNRHVSAKLRVFIDWVVEVMERLPSRS
jgi:DNA-binding transcriptional LysR family regulator